MRVVDELVAESVINAPHALRWGVWQDGALVASFAWRTDADAFARVPVRQAPVSDDGYEHVYRRGPRV